MTRGNKSWQVVTKAPFTLAEIMLATDGCGRLPPHCPPSPMIASTLSVHCQCVAIIANGCQRLATFSNCLKKLPNVALVTSIVNELRMSLQLLHGKAVTNGLNVLTSNGAFQCCSPYELRSYDTFGNFSFFFFETLHEERTKHSDL